MVRPQLRPHTPCRNIYGIKFKDKRLDITIWRCKGEHQKCSHSPICVFTNNVGRRSPQKLEERKQKQIQRSWRGSQWWPTRGRDCSPPARARPQQWSQGCPPLRAIPQQSQAQERPAVAGENADAFARWRERSWCARERGGRRLGHEATRTSGDQPHSQASSETWIADWRGSWPVQGGQMWPAVAAEATSADLNSWWPTEQDQLDNLTPAAALQRVARSACSYSWRVAL